MKSESQTKSRAAKVLDAAIVTFLFVFAAAAPNSIAATQSAWLVGLALWLVRFAFRPRPKFYRTPIDYLILSFFVLTVLSSFLSYEPVVSFGKLRAASLFTIIYLFVENVTSLRVARLLALTLISACMVNALYTAGERLVGRAVRVDGVSENSPLYKAGIRNGDTLLEVDGEKLRDPQQLINALLKPDKNPAAVLTYRHELQPVFKVPRGSLLPGNTVLEQLGIESSSRGRDWRATGFYGQFVTYAEALQLIIALAMGIFVSLPVKRSWLGALLMVALAGLGSALLLTVTRASWLRCLVSSNCSAPQRWATGDDFDRRLGSSAHTCRPVGPTAEAQRCLYRSNRPIDDLARNSLARRRKFAGQQAAAPDVRYWHGLDKVALARVGHV